MSDKLLKIQEILKKPSKHINPYKTKQFLTIKKKWYKKLKRHFNDLESFGSNFKYIGLSTPFLASLPPLPPDLVVISTRNYYSLLESYYNDHDFEYPVEKTIIKYHCQGMPYTQIIKKVKQFHGLSLSGYTISDVINRHLLEIGRLNGLDDLASPKNALKASQDFPSLPKFKRKSKVKTLGKLKKSQKTIS